jgi:uncharacterized protein YdcH (DUF465 family)
MADAQLSQDDAVRATLLRTDDGFRQLVSEHHQLDEEIHRLSISSHLTEEQQLEETALKKKKLALKDRIETTLRRFHGNGDVAVPSH